MVDVFHRSFFIDGPAGRLEAILWTVGSPNPPFAGIVCHPHPLYGGTMHNKVVYQTAKAMHDCGAPVLRFNFRGVGTSEGVHDEGVGERNDVHAALDSLAAEVPNRPIVLAGFSFGAVVGLQVGCEDARVTRLIGLGLPVNRSDFAYLLNCSKPKLLLNGGNDEFGSVANINALVSRLPGPTQLVIVPGVDHFFAGKLDAVGDTIRRWLTQDRPNPKSSL